MKKVLVAIIGVVIISLICFGLYKFFTKDNSLENSTNTPVVEVVDNTTNVVNETNDDTTSKLEAIFTEETYPRIDGSTATIPLSEAFKATFLGKDIKDVSVVHNTTHNAYLNLIDGKADLILVTYPSEEEFNYAKEKNVELEIIPVVNEAFVFYTNVNNPVKSLTLEQIQKIYTGEITNWKEVGGNDANIIAYQREPNSGSQTGMLKLVMKGLNLVEPPKEGVIDTMAGIVDLVSDYENGSNAIGYSYYYYATTMYDTINKEVADRIHLLGVNGIEPNNTTIKDGSYPIRTNYYIVYNKNIDENSDVRKLADAMLSYDGQKAAESVGYVGVK